MASQATVADAIVPPGGAPKPLETPQLAPSAGILNPTKVDLAPAVFHVSFRPGENIVIPPSALDHAFGKSGNLPDGRVSHPVGISSVQVLPVGTTNNSGGDVGIRFNNAVTDPGNFKITPKGKLVDAKASHVVIPGTFAHQVEHSDNPIMSSVVSLSHPLTMSQVTQQITTKHVLSGIDPKTIHKNVQFGGRALDDVDETGSAHATTAKIPHVQCTVVNGRVVETPNPLHEAIQSDLASGLIPSDTQVYDVMHQFGNTAHMVNHKVIPVEEYEKAKDRLSNLLIGGSQREPIVAQTFSLHHGPHPDPDARVKIALKVTSHPTCVYTPVGSK